MIRAKFQCLSVRKYKSNVWDTEGKNYTEGFTYEYEFQAVTGSGSDENKLFFASTPSGNLKMGAVREDLFEPGKTYYLDFTPAS